ncbi:MAG: hypothetical protein WBP81_23350 [Solirubrobacteraceae bacterium]
MDQQRVALRAAAVDRLGELHGFEGVDQPGTLVICRGAEVGRGADDDLFNEGRGRHRPPVRLGESLNDKCRGARGLG